MKEKKSGNEGEKIKGERDSASNYFNTIVTATVCVYIVFSLT